MTSIVIAPAAIMQPMMQVTSTLNQVICHYKDAKAI